MASLILSGKILYGTTDSGGNGGSGTVFGVNTDGSDFSVLYNFTATSGPRSTNSDGTFPEGIILSSNILYGTAYNGGKSGKGTVFSLKLNLQNPPFITTQPQNQTVQVDSNVTLNITASGQSLNYQWFFNSHNIPNATNATLTLNSVTAANSGGYFVVVSNSYGSAASATASLAVLTDGANGNKPAQTAAPSCPAPQAGKDSLVLITHGWSFFYPDVSWITTMANAIQSKVPSNWEVRTLDWTSVSWFPDPDVVMAEGAIGGQIYGEGLSQKHWKYVHLIGHSAGAAVIEGIAKVLATSLNPPQVIQETFLDPYTGHYLTGRSIFGVNANWADNYFVTDFASDYLPVGFGWTPGSTSGQLEWAYNVDVGGALQAATPVQYFVGSGIAGSTPAYIAASPSPSHGTPIDFYLSTINGTANGCAAGYGFPLSIEAGGSGNWASHSLNYPPLPLCGTMSLSQNQQPVRSDAPFVFSVVPNGTSSSGVNFVGDSGASLNCSLSPQAQVKSGGMQPSDNTSSTNIPAWLAVGVTITNAVNFVQFDADFTDTNAAEGLLTIYWNTNQVGMVDERVAETNLQTYRFALPGTMTSGLYTLSFRLDSFVNSSSIAVTNLATGFVGVTQPITLGISLTNGVPLLQLTAATNFTYLIQSSTNLVNWTPTALLLNTNGTAQFTDSAVTNSDARFYRATLP